MSFEVEFKGEKIININDGQTILEASLKAGIPHYHECGGNAKCSTCRILVLKGQEQLSAPNSKELKLKKLLGFNDSIRLACQTTITGDSVVVRRLIRDHTDVSIYSSLVKKDETFLEVGEEKDLALFFLDIRNFTPFMQQNLPFDVIHMIRRLFQIFKTNIETHHGKIIETAGDGFYAVFGIDCPLKEGVNNALIAGEHLLVDLNDFNETYAKKYFNHCFEVGIGLHAGTVIVGNIGLGISNNLTAMGLPVNIASRLQAATKELNNSFVVSDYAYSFSQDTTKSPRTADIYLRGLSGICKVFLLGDSYNSTIQQSLL
ncbi:MAG: adenylate/guanylate cyclase domain-containing protein [Ginsengibacter sp.]